MRDVEADVSENAVFELDAAFVESVAEGRVAIGGRAGDETPVVRLDSGQVCRREAGFGEAVEANGSVLERQREHGRRCVGIAYKSTDAPRAARPKEESERPRRRLGGEASGVGAFFTAWTAPTAMSDDELEAAVAKFLKGADKAYSEYEKGYVDADATLSVLETHLDELRETHESA